MATDDKDKEVHGRKYDQLTRNGTSSAGSMGTDSTGDLLGQGTTAGSQQAGRQGGSASGVRIDDLLSDGCDADTNGEGYNSESTAELQTGMGGIGSLSGSGAGNRQSGSGTQPGGQSGAMNTADSQASGSKEESGGQRIGTPGNKG